MRYLPLILLTLTATFFSACTIAKPSYDASNQKILEDTMNDIQLGATLKSKLPSGTNIALRSMEQKRTLDKPVDALVQDIAIRSLVNNGFRTLERDEDALFNLQLEDNRFLKVEQYQRTLIDDLDVEKLQLNSLVALTLPEESLKQSSLRSADYILSYRVLEAGVKYHSLDDGFQWSDMGTLRFWFEPVLPWAFEQEIERESMMRLHVRAIKAKTGEIVYAENLKSSKNEIINKNLSKKLKDYHYDFFKAGLPVQNTITAEDKVVRNSAEKSTTQSDSPFALFLALFPVEDKSPKETIPLTNTTKSTTSRFGVDVLYGLDTTFGYGVNYMFDFGRIGILGMIKNQSNAFNSNLTDTYTHTAFMYSIIMGDLQLHAGYALGGASTYNELSDTTIGTFTTEGFAYGVSYKLLSLLNLTAHYYFFSEHATGFMISGGLDF